MKTELATAIGTAIIGTLIAYFIGNLFMGEIEPVTIPVLESSVGSDIGDPDPNVFNYKSLNPTVEVYVGDCVNTDASGNCLATTQEEGNE